NVRARLEDSDEDLDVSSSPTTSKNKGKGKSVQISDEVEEREYYVDDYGDEDEEGRFYGGGLTEEQKRILELVDEVETEEVVGQFVFIEKRDNTRVFANWYACSISGRRIRSCRCAKIDS